MAEKQRTEAGGGRMTSPTSQGCPSLGPAFSKATSQWPVQQEPVSEGATRRHLSGPMLSTEPPAPGYDLRVQMQGQAVVQAVGGGNSVDLDLLSETNSLESQPQTDSAVEASLEPAGPPAPCPHCQEYR